jgi:hypothetical protein
VTLQSHLAAEHGGAPRCQHILLPTDHKSRAKYGPRQCGKAAEPGSNFCGQHPLNVEPLRKPQTRAEAQADSMARLQRELTIAGTLMERFRTALRLIRDNAPNPAAVAGEALQTHSMPDGTTKLGSEELIRRLEEAGATLLALPNGGWSTKLGAGSAEILRSALENYGWHPERIRPPAPSAAHITRMDEALTWLGLIPLDRYVLRRIVGARSLVNPVTQRHLFAWRRLAAALGADHKAIQRWHAQAIDIIVAKLAESAR